MALIRSEGKTFQQASIIVLRYRHPNGYVLKKNVTELDKDGKSINIQTPDDKTNGVRLDFSKITLKPKYPT